MSRSMNEVAALVAKAARGAGAPPAQAALFGQVAAVHLAARRGCDDVRAALDALPDGPVLDGYVMVQTLLRSGRAEPVPMSVDLLRSFLDLVPHPVTVDAQNEAVIADRSQRQPQYPTARCAVPQAFSDYLTSLAARTLVPESESSRQGGAGAGLLDND